jgi:hypothetical protein
MPFAERHYTKAFAKKYKNGWLETRNNIDEVCKRIDKMLDFDRADLIYSVGYYKLVKLDFSIAGTRISPKKSGNRCLLFVDEERRYVQILMAYSKNDISPPNETAKWKRIIKAEYRDIAGIFPL